MGLKPRSRRSLRGSGAIQRIRARTKATPAEVMSAQTPSYGSEVPIRDDPQALLKMYREWVYACVTKTAQGVAAIPLRVYVSKPSKTTRTLYNTRAVPPERRSMLEGREHLQKYIRRGADLQEVVDHPFYALWDEGNPHMTGAQLKRTIISYIDLVGDCYAYIVEGKYGPEDILLLPPDQMRVLVSKDVDFIAGYVQRKGTQEVRFAPDEIMHLKWPDPNDPVYGFAPLEAVGLTAGLYHKMNIYEMALMDHNAVPGLVGIAPKGISRTERERAERKWTQRNEGPARVGKFTIISGEMTLHQFGLTQKDMSFPAGRMLARQEIAAVYGIPDSLLVSSGASLANVKVGEYSMATHAILPRCVLLEEQINRDIMSKYDEPNAFVAFDNPIPADATQGLAAVQIMIQTDGVVRINEVRQAMGLDADPKFEGKWFKREKPVGFVRPPKQPGDDKPPNADADGSEIGINDDKSMSSPNVKAQREKELEDERRRKELQAALALLFISQGEELALMHEYSASTNVEIDVDKWARRFEDACAVILSIYAIEGLRRGSIQVGTTLGFDTFNSEVVDFIRQYTYRFAFGVNQTSQNMLRELFIRTATEGRTVHETAVAIRALFKDMSEWRAERIARTEIARAQRAGQIKAWQESGVVLGYHWQTMGDALVCEFCLATEEKYGVGKTMISIGQPVFDQGTELRGTKWNSAQPNGHTMVLDYEMVMGPPLHPNCRCELVPVLIGE